MNIRTRKAIGTFATVAWLFIYALLAMGVGANYVVGNGALVEFAFFVVAGFAWIPVAMLIIKWISRPDAEP